MRARFDADGITFSRYPFPPASVRRDRHLAWSAIRDIDPGAAPPEIRTVEGETLFVEAKQADELWAACDAAGVSLIERVDVWDLLLEPYLDTSFDAEHKARTSAALERCGISRRETSRIRRRVGASMLAYNSVLWDWVHLGLYDLLTATRRTPTMLTLQHRLSPRRYAAFYRWTMEIADRGLVRSGLDPATDAIVNAVNRDGIELCAALFQNSLNYSVSMRLFAAAGAAGESIDSIARRAIGESTVVGGEPTITSLGEMIAEIEECLRFAGDSGSHPNPAHSTDPAILHRISSIARRLRGAFAESTSIHSVWFAAGRPFTPVFWDFAFVIERDQDAFVLAGASSD